MKNNFSSKLVFTEEPPLLIPPDHWSTTIRDPLIRGEKERVGESTCRGKRERAGARGGKSERAQERAGASERACAGERVSGRKSGRAGEREGEREKEGERGKERAGDSF